jgi:hypothetical protein
MLILRDDEAYLPKKLGATTGWGPDAGLATTVFKLRLTGR